MVSAHSCAVCLVSDMKCKNCKRQIDDDSIFCKWCGQRQIKEARQEIRVPQPKQKPNGKWFIQLRMNGQSQYILEETEAKCRAKAVAIKSGLIESRTKSSSTLRAACDRYIADRSNVLSPSTIRGYRTIQTSRFQSVMDKPISSVSNWQKVCNDEAKIYSAKTVKNSWGFIRAVLKNEGVDADATTPKIEKNQRPWLTPEQIPLFLQIVHGKACEVPALLALHSLRRSELAALTWDNVNLDDGYIVVSGSAVPDENEKIIFKTLNKTEASARSIPILIPALREALEAEPDKTGLVFKGHINAPYKQIIRLCEKHGLPTVGVHGLRHSFASLGYFLRMSPMEVAKFGGWSDLETVHKIYTHLSDQDMATAANKMSDFYESASDFNPISRATTT